MRAPVLSLPLYLVLWLTSALPNSAHAQGTIQLPSRPVIRPLAQTLRDADNWDFERGTAGWYTEPGRESTLGEVIVQRRTPAELPGRPPTAMPLGGDYWLPAADTEFAGDDGAHGAWLLDTGAPEQGGTDRSIDRRITLWSKEFSIRKPYIQLLVGGIGAASVQLEVKPTTDAQRATLAATGQRPNAAGYYPVGAATRGTSAILRREVWDVHAFAGLTGRIVVTDPGPGYIAIDDIQFTDFGTALAMPAVARPRALWGFADTHTHPAAQLAFGGQLYFADPDGDCTAVHGWNGLGLRNSGEAVGISLPAVLDLLGTVLNPVGLIAAGITVAVDSPMALVYRFVGDLNINADQVSRLSYIGVENSLGHRSNSGPRYNSRTHQHMTDEWIRRAYDGGLRLMVAHAIETELIANLNPVPGAPLDPRGSADRQIEAIKAMAARNAAWMQIAYTPREARDIIGANKLAVILGVEVDNLGNIGRGVAPTEANVAAELDRLYRMGVRHVFPIHLADNPFGGASLYNSIFDLNSWVLNGAMHQVEDGRSQLVEYKSLEGFGGMFTPQGPLDPNRVKELLRRKGLDRLRLNGGMVIDFGRALDDIIAFRDARAAEDRSGRVMMGHVNRLGLSPLGRFTVDRMMTMGFIVDIDHMSGHSARETIQIAQTHANERLAMYPLIAGHCSIRMLAWPGNATSDEHKRASEGNLPEDIIDAIRASGGMMSPNANGSDVRPGGGSVPNDSPGSSRSWAQQYLYASRRMGERGVGLATDMAMAGALGPRFGLQAAPALAGDLARATGGRVANGGVVDSRPPLYRPSRMAERGDAARADDDRMVNGHHSMIQRMDRPVAYRTPLTDWSQQRFDGNGLYTDDERDAFFAVSLNLRGMGWQAVERQIDNEENMPSRGMLTGIWRSINNQHPLGKALDGRRKYIINICKGLDRLVENPLLGDSFKGPDIAHASQSAADWCRGNPARDFAADDYRPFLDAHRRTNRFPPDEALFQTTFDAVRFAYRQLTRIRQANNAPLTRSVTRTHQYDFNLDGLAHYGLVPDMLQDLKNSGMSAKEFSTLFRSAEDFVQMWEKCYELRRAVPPPGG